MIRMNLINNNQVTNQDTELAEKVCGPDTGSTKEKSARTRQKQRTDDTIAIPKESMRMHLKMITLGQTIHP